VNNLPKVEREAPRPGIEPATSWLQVRRPNHYATKPQHILTSILINRLTKLNVYIFFIFNNYDHDYKFVWLTVTPVKSTANGAFVTGRFTTTDSLSTLTVCSINACEILH